MKLNPPNAHRSQIKICEKRQTRNVQFRFMPNAFRILKPIQKSSKCVWVFRNTVANAFAKNQTRLAYEDKRDLYCIDCWVLHTKRYPSVRIDEENPRKLGNKRSMEVDVKQNRWTSTSCWHCNACMIICLKALAFAGHCTQSCTHQ